MCVCVAEVAAAVAFAGGAATAGTGE